MMTDFTTTQVAKILNIPMRKILSYIERGYIKPSIQEADGHPSKRLWAIWDLNKIHLIRKLELWGMSVKSLRNIAGILVPPFWPDVLLKTREYPYLVLDEYGGIAPIEYSIEKQLKNAPSGLFLVIKWKDFIEEVEEILEKTGFR